MLYFNVIETTSRHRSSPVNLLRIFSTAFPKKTSGRLLLKSGFKHSKNHVVGITKPSFIRGGVFKGIFSAC